MKGDIRKITVGDNSGSSRRGTQFAVTRPKLLKEIEVGEELLVRFKDEINVTGYRRYRLARKFFKDHYDADREVYTGVFERAEPGKDLAHSCASTK